MKTRSFSTTKGDFVLVDRPEIIETLTITMDGTFCLNRESLPYKVQRIGDPKTLTEEQAAEIVDELGPFRFKNYTYEPQESGGQRVAMVIFPFTKNALNSLYSLFASLGIHLYENPVSSKFAIGRHKEWEEAEANTFYNPIILKKI